MLVSLTLSGNAIAEDETNDAAEPSESLLDAASRAGTPESKPGAFLSSPDFRDVRMTAEPIDEPLSPSFKMFGAGMFIVSGADLASTELALGRTGVREANPLQRNRSVRILSHAVAPALMYCLTDKLHKSGRPKLALLARLGFTIGYSYVVMHNLRTAAAAP